LLDADINARKGGLNRRGVGAGAGTIIRSTVGYAAPGLLIGGPVGLIAGALIGDHLMGHQHEQAARAKQNDREVERFRRENQRLRQERIER
jgi:hypothetical protein